jgi:hypothetical protein
MSSEEESAGGQHEDKDRNVDPYQFGPRSTVVGIGLFAGLAAVFYAAGRVSTQIAPDLWSVPISGVGYIWAGIASIVLVLIYFAVVGGLIAIVVTFADALGSVTLAKWGDWRNE